MVVLGGELASEVSALVAEERGQRQKIDYNARSRQSAEDEIAKLDARRMVALAEQGGYISARHLSSVFDEVRPISNDIASFAKPGHT